MTIKATFIAAETIIPYVEPILPLLEAAEAMFKATFKTSEEPAQYCRISDGWVAEEYVTAFESPEALLALAETKGVPLTLEIATMLLTGISVIRETPIEETLQVLGLVPVAEV